jgi:hypothetical protein
VCMLVVDQDWHVTTPRFGGMHCGKPHAHHNISERCSSVLQFGMMTSGKERMSAELRFRFLQNDWDDCRNIQCSDSVNTRRP